MTFISTRRAGVIAIAKASVGAIDEHRFELLQREAHGPDDEVVRTLDRAIVTIHILIDELEK